MVFQAPKLCIIYLLIIIFLLLINPCATQISFNYTDFSQTINNKPIIRTGIATISGSVIQLTPDEVDNWGRAIYSEQMHLWDEKSGKVASFTSNFSFIIDSQGKDSYSDGIVFFLSTPNYPPSSPTDGSGLSLLSRNQMQQPSFLAENKFFCSGVWYISKWWIWWTEFSSWKVHMGSVQSNPTSTQGFNI